MSRTRQPNSPRVNEPRNIKERATAKRISEQKYKPTDVAILLDAYTAKDLKDHNDRNDK